MRQALRVVALMAMVGAVFCLGANPPQKPAQIKVLLITGDDVGAHPWREISETTREILVGSGKFDVKVSEDPLILESATALKNYDVIVFTIYAQKLGDLTPQGGSRARTAAAGAASQIRDPPEKLCGGCL